MDAHDIFIKLSRGAKFKRKPMKPTPILKPEVMTIKTEPIDEPTLDAPEMNYVANDATITLLGNMSATQNSKQGKKRKLKPECTDDKKRMLLAQERINQYRNENNISVVGRHIAEPAKSFDDVKIDADLKANIKNCGYNSPTPIQIQAIPILLDNRQLLACAPTGSGKTAAFLVPIIQALKSHTKSGFRALILCPTRELAKQTQQECMRLIEGRDLKTHVITKIKSALTRSHKYDILITTPNRLCFLLNQDERVVNLGGVEWVVIDEADKLFEEGTRSFKDQLTQILKECDNSARKIAMFSATYTPAVAKWCVHNMKGLIRLTVGQRNAATDLIDQELQFVGNEAGKLLAFRDLVRKGLTPPVLVFVQSKERAQQLFSELIYDGINVDAIHADRTQLQRDNTVRSFREGKIWVLICTELMARGVDFKGVNLVINYDFPPSAIAYIHRIGRAGRAGRRGKAITFFTLEDTVNLRSIAHVLKQSGCEVPDYMLYMKKHSKKEKKRLEISAPKRDDILTIPKDERRRINRALGKSRLTEAQKKKIKSAKNKKGEGDNKKKHVTIKNKEKTKKVKNSKNEDDKNRKKSGKEKKMLRKKEKVKTNISVKVKSKAKKFQKSN